MSDGVNVTLGSREYRIVPQRIGRIRHSISSIVGVFSEDAPQEVDDQLIEFFKVFIPDLEPKYKLLGYASEDACEAKDYDPAADQSPTPPEIADAIETIFQIHGGQRLLRLLKGLIDPAVIRETVTMEMKNYQRRRLQSLLSSGDGPASTTTTPPSPTPEPSAPEIPPLMGPPDTPPTEQSLPANGASLSPVS